MPNRSPENATPAPEVLEGQLVVGDARVAIAVARFNEYITNALLDGAVNTWVRLGGDPSKLTVAWVPGSFELPVTAKKLAETGKYEAVICLGCVIKGETDHYDHVVEQTVKGIREVGTQTGLPIIFGVLTCETVEQAINRAGAKMGNAGRSSMMAAVEMAHLLRQV